MTAKKTARPKVDPAPKYDLVKEKFDFAIESMHSRFAMVELIGKMDRLLSEAILMSEAALDKADLHTLKHHAEDMIGAGQKILKTLAARK